MKDTIKGVVGCNEQKIVVSTQMYPPGIVAQQIDVMGDIIHRTADIASQQMEEKIREALIGLGWTPPKTNTNRRGSV